ncbi:MAG: hypothetical protein WA324_23085 [Bryobacteraceae bacterium]
MASKIVVSPPVSVSVSPSTATLSSSGTVQLAASVTNTTNTAVKWSLSPALGTISTSGLYTAPPTIASTTSVTVTATSQAQTSRSGSAVITLISPAVTTITLPLEVMGATATTKSVQVNVPANSALTGPLNLWLQIHGLEYQTQASVQVNNGAWIALNSQNVALQGLASNYGGIGGGFSTLSMTVALPQGLVTSGINTINFKFNGTDGNSSGFRVLAFNIQESNGTQLIPSTAFAQDNPASWTIPLNDAADIAAGQTLWSSATIKQPVSGGSPTTLQAHCGDCHTADGRDLKYFNYSNNAIEIRAAFHGLNSTQGAQIASYIRSLSTPAPATARPWNPPYQPGPGLDSQPVADWAAGAGIGAVLGTDAAMMSEIAPTLTSTDFDPTQYMNSRETQLALQLPDWNHWLPRIHPLDAWGSAFTNSQLYQTYPALKSSLLVANAPSYVNSSQYWGYWVNYQISFLSGEDQNFPNPVTASQAIMLHSTALWRMVKQWEIMQEFQLEGMGQTYFTALNADTRAWPNQGAFYASPALNGIPDGSPGIGNGLYGTFLYHSLVWYQMQIILNSGNGTQSGPYPVDWAYTYGRMWQMNTLAPQAMLQMSMLKKALGNSKQFMGPPSEGQNGWMYSMNDISTLVNPVFESMWANTSDTQRAEIMESYVINWLNEVQAYTPQQFYAGGSTSASEVPANNDYPGSTFSSKVYFAIPRLRYHGVSLGTVQRLAAWGQTMWPSVNWNVLPSWTCSPSNNGNYICQ